MFRESDVRRELSLLYFKYGGKSSVAHHGYLQFGGAVYGARLTLVIHGQYVGIDAVLEAGHLVFLSCGEETEVERQVALRTVGHTAYVPLVAVALGRYAVLSGLGCQHFGVVPVDRY